jgi:HD-GYP domain-containing protein (c-di-GMP phosphodiesterase class II)
LQTAARLEGTADLTYLTFALHDIGKLMVPADLICKPSALTADEYRTVQQHPELGAALIADIPQLKPAFDVIVAHHERWDGEGYPHRLRGEEIPLSARILAVADTFDAMTTDRPYRKGLTAEAARQEIIRCAGTQFDPRVVEAFIAASPTLSRPRSVAVELLAANWYLTITS